MKIKALLIINCLLILASCHRSDKTEEGSTIFVEVNTELMSPLTDFICAERHVCLETNDSCLLSGVGAVEISGDILYVQDGTNIYKFASSGKYLDSFNHHGSGPGEYNAINRMRVYDEEIYILDRSLRKIFKYSANGDFIRAIKLDYEYIDFLPSSNERIILASGNFNESMSEFVIMDSRNGNVCTKLGDYGIAQTSTMWEYMPFCGQSKDEIYVNVPFSHCTYQLSEYKLDSIACYHFNTQYQLPKFSMQDMDISELLFTTQNMNVVRQLGCYYPAEECSYLSFLLFGKYGIKSHLAKFDNNGKCLAQTTIGVEDNVTYPYFSDIRYIINGEIVTICNSDYLLTTDERLNRQYWKDQGLTEDSNPVIFFYKLQNS